MANAPNDLAPLLAPRPASGIGIKQGVVISWNTATGANTIDVDGATFTNLPYLNTSEASLLAAGDVVCVVTASPTWFVLGRVIQPGA